MPPASQRGKQGYGSRGALSSAEDEGRAGQARLWLRLGTGTSQVTLHGARPSASFRRGPRPRAEHGSQQGDRPKLWVSPPEGVGAPAGPGPQAGWSLPAARTPTRTRTGWDAASPTSGSSRRGQRACGMLAPGQQTADGSLKGLWLLPRPGVSGRAQHGPACRAAGAHPGPQAKHLHWAAGWASVSGFTACLALQECLPFNVSHHG